MRRIVCHVVYGVRYAHGTSLLAPVHTIFPEENTSAVDLGSRMRMITAENRLGLYSALRARMAICFKSSLHSKFT